MKRIHVYFSGRVQGVGFRNTTQGYGRELGLQGWVRNLEDGRVEMIAEGNPAVLNELLGRLRARFHITDLEMHESEALGELTSFEIRS